MRKRAKNQTWACGAALLVTIGDGYLGRFVTEAPASQPASQLASYVLTMMLHSCMVCP